MGFMGSMHVAMLPFRAFVSLVYSDLGRFMGQHGRHQVSEANTEPREASKRWRKPLSLGRTMKNHDIRLRLFLKSH